MARCTAGRSFIRSTKAVQRGHSSAMSKSKRRPAREREQVDVGDRVSVEAIERKGAIAGQYAHAFDNRHLAMQ